MCSSDLHSVGLGQSDSVGSSPFLLDVCFKEKNKSQIIIKIENVEKSEFYLTNLKNDLKKFRLFSPYFLKLVSQNPFFSIFFIIIII